MTPKPKDERTPFNFGSALAIGISLGLIFGTALGNTAIGLVSGLALATLANAIQQKRQNAKNANVALAISIGAVLFVIVIWILSAN